MSARELNAKILSQYTDYSRGMARKMEIDPTLCGGRSWSVDHYWVFGTLIGRLCVVSESSEDYKTKKVNKRTHEQGLITRWGDHSDAYLWAYT